MMRNRLISLAIILALNSCASTAKFPVSAVAPAAQISIKKKKDNYKNIVIELKAKHLASPDRLNPPGQAYNVWIVTKDYGVKNVGQWKVQNGKNTSFKATTPFDFREVFITVENNGVQQYPSGNEISRARI